MGHLKVVYGSRGFNTSFYFLLFVGKIFLANVVLFIYFIYFFILSEFCGWIQESGKISRVLVDLELLFDSQNILVVPL